MNKVFIIAEAGVNHNGSVEIAKKLIDEAVIAGADAVKFQTFKAENLVTKNASKAEYQKQQTNGDESQLDMLKNLELSFEEFIELNKYCVKKDIEFLSTAFDYDSIDFLNSIGMKIWKIPSGEITNLPYLIKVASFRTPIILSTGMSNIEEIRDAVSVLRENGSTEITVLHCTTEYPTPYRDVNLNAMHTIKSQLDLPIGYSDHTKGIEVSIAAVALGATVIEKHFTLDKNMNGPDHKASIEPNELKEMIQAIRNVQISMGSSEKKLTESEKSNVLIARKSIIAKRNIKKGEVFTKENLTIKRPGNGISPMKWFEVIGKTAIRNFEEDELIEI
ncbi:MAG: N-acetylneuraminate synthase [Clostridium sulfidigenes]|uniref:N-acetylneuraminate synthase n=1 Tax=Clostridium sulfidigenes TaxID=318464 RepID=A0A927WAR6_9CLOT|nr:N-acetylneuraminate synthase [Clostridium sulfidigenes]